MTYTKLFEEALAALTATSPVARFGTIATDLLEHSTIHLNVPRASGKSNFIEKQIFYGDLYLYMYPTNGKVATPRKASFEDVLSRKAQFMCGGLTKGPSRYLFMDDCVPTKQLLNQLIICHMIDHRTKIFSLTTEVRV